MPRKTCSNLALGLVLQHEAHRDGIISTASRQSAETLAATTAHTQIALNMAADSRYTQSIMSLASGNQNLQNDLNAYIAAYQYGNSTIFSDYVAGNYDSSADYWRLMDDGSIAYDGQADLYDVNGNLIYKTQSRGLEGSLVEILYGKNATPEEVEKVQQFMVKSGMLHTVDKQNPTSSDLWRWDVIGSVGDNALNKWFFTENVDVKEHNMGKVISLTGIRDVLASSDNSSTDLQILAKECMRNR